MPFLLRAIAWLAIDLVAIVVGATIGVMLTPKVNPHNDWGVTGMLYLLVGALVGNGVTIVLLLWMHPDRPRGSHESADAKPWMPGDSW